MNCLKTSFVQKVSRILQKKCALDYIYSVSKRSFVRDGRRDWLRATSLQLALCETCPICHRIPPRSGEPRTQKLKSHLVRTQSLNFLPLKPGVGQYVVIHATLTAMDFFLAYFYPSGPFTCIFSKTSLDFFLCWLWLTPVPVQARRIKQVTLLDAGSPVECLRNINRLKNMTLWCDDFLEY